MVSAYYCGDLNEGKCQFTFEGGVKSCDKIGFLIPHSGRIKKIKVRIHGTRIPPYDLSSGDLFGDLFSIILFKGEGSVGTILTTYKCFFGLSEDDGDFDTFRRCIFEKIIKNYSVSEGDVINIRTEKKF